MKKTLWLILLALLATWHISEARNYPLTIAGIRVTDTNCTNIRGQGITGSVSYNPATRTLSLNNAEITYSYHIIECDSTIFINLAGQNALINLSGLGDALYAKGDSLVIDGPDGSSLNAVVFCSGINSQYGTHLIVRGGCTLISYGYYGITATGNRAGERFTIDRSHIIAKGSTDYSIGGFTTVTYINTCVTQPIGASYNLSTKRMVDTNGISITDTVRIDPVYPLKVTNVDVAWHNADSITSPYITSGLVRYDPSSRTLTLKDVTITSNTSINRAIECYEDITINYIGTNNISAYNVGISLEGNNNVIQSQAGSSLNISAFTGVYSRGTLTIKTKGQLQNNATYTNFQGDGASILKLDKSSVFFKRCALSHVNNYSRLLLNECEPVQPVGTTVGPNNFAYRNTPYPNQVDIVVDTVGFDLYPVWVAGYHLDNYNFSSLLSIPGVNLSHYGTPRFQYDTTTQTISFEHIVINSPDAPCLRCDSNITIKLNGDSWFLTDTSQNGQHFPAIELNGDSATIIGNGGNSTLALQSRLCPAISVKRQLTLDSITLLAGGEGIVKKQFGSNPYGELTINSSTVKILPEQGSGYITNFNQLTLNNCQIVQPAGAFYSNSAHHIVDSNRANIENDTVVISTESPSCIETAEADNPALSPNPASDHMFVNATSPVEMLQIYDIQGRMLQELRPGTRQTQIDTRSLPDGIYAVRIRSAKGVSTKKIIVRH